MGPSIRPDCTGSSENIDQHLGDNTDSRNSSDQDIEVSETSVTSKTSEASEISYLNGMDSGAGQQVRDTTDRLSRRNLPGTRHPVATDIQFRVSYRSQIAPCCWSLVVVSMVSVTGKHQSAGQSITSPQAVNYNERADIGVTIGTQLVVKPTKSEFLEFSTEGPSRHCCSLRWDGYCAMVAMYMRTTPSAPSCFPAKLSFYSAGLLFVSEVSFLVRSLSCRDVPPSMHRCSVGLTRLEQRLAEAQTHWLTATAPMVRSMLLLLCREDHAATATQQPLKVCTSQPERDGPNQLLGRHVPSSLEAEADQRGRLLIHAVLEAAAGVPGLHTVVLEADGDEALLHQQLSHDGPPTSSLYAHPSTSSAAPGASEASSDRWAHRMRVNALAATVSDAAHKIWRDTDLDRDRKQGSDEGSHFAGFDKVQVIWPTEKPSAETWFRACRPHSLLASAVEHSLQRKQLAPTSATHDPRGTTQATCLTCPNLRKLCILTLEISSSQSGYVEATGPVGIAPNGRNNLDWAAQASLSPFNVDSCYETGSMFSLRRWVLRGASRDLWESVTHDDDDDDDSTTPDYGPTYKEKVPTNVPRHHSGQQQQRHQLLSALAALTEVLEANSSLSTVHSDNPVAVAPTFFLLVPPLLPQQKISGSSEQRQPMDTVFAEKSDALPESSRRPSRRPCSDPNNSSFVSKQESGGTWPQDRHTPSNNYSAAMIFDSLEVLAAAAKLRRSAPYCYQPAAASIAAAYASKGWETQDGISMRWHLQLLCHTSPLLPYSFEATSAREDFQTDAALQVPLWDAPALHTIIPFLLSNIALLLALKACTHPQAAPTLPMIPYEIARVAPAFDFDALLQLFQLFAFLNDALLVHCPEYGVDDCGREIDMLVIIERYVTLRHSAKDSMFGGIGFGVLSTSGDCIAVAAACTERALLCVQKAYAKKCQTDPREAVATFIHSLVPNWESRRQLLCFYPAKPNSDTCCNDGRAGIPDLPIVGGSESEWLRQLWVSRKGYIDTWHTLADVCNGDDSKAREVGHAQPTGKSTPHKPPNSYPTAAYKDRFVIIPDALNQYSAPAVDIYDENAYLGASGETVYRPLTL